MDSIKEFITANAVILLTGSIQALGIIVNLFLYQRNKKTDIQIETFYKKVHDNLPELWDSFIGYYDNASKFFQIVLFKAQFDKIELAKDLLEESNIQFEHLYKVIRINEIYLKKTDYEDLKKIINDIESIKEKYTNTFDCEYKKIIDTNPDYVFSKNELLTLSRDLITKKRVLKESIFSILKGGVIN